MKGWGSLILNKNGSRPKLFIGNREQATVCVGGGLSNRLQKVPEQLLIES